ncbi:MAG: ligase-associated DNA damage response endonuclease PdeM [Sphingobium sp.]|jgi:DNA ligase-associated metallophosphoesterase|nr:MAG: ligase-associated DNA damage response endonuclease PdeM [Sphingobium sp.]
MVPLSFAGQDFLALPQAALFWPSRRALLVADLHFEKASWFARRGQMLPPYDSAETLALIEGLVATTGARELWCLGDSFHDGDGAARLPGDVRARLDALTRRIDWSWVVGNHDAGLDMTLGGRIVAEAEVDGIILRHEAEADDPRAEISGHFHPKLRLSLRGRHVSRRCFVRAPGKLVMPAFGVLTGGLDAGHDAIREAVGVRAEALVPVADKLLRFPLGSRNG